MDNRKPYILFADDDNNILDAFREYCRAFDWIGDFVNSAEQIVLSVNQNCHIGGRSYDAIVCDINHYRRDDGPTISNVAAVRTIRENYPEIPVVFVSSHSSYWIKDEIKKIGGELFAKPIDFEHLFERIAFLVKWHWQTQTPPDVPTDRRRSAINHSGHSRRKTDAAVEIPTVLKNTVQEMRDAGPSRPGH